MRSFFALILSWFKKVIAKLTGKDIIETPEVPDIDRPEDGPGEIVCYYGCPNSKKAKKLQLSKNLYR